MLEQALTTALAMSFDDRRLMSVASGLGQLEDPSLAMQAIDLLLAVGQFALLNAWWLSPPDPEVIQPFLISRVVGKSPTLRSACARLLGGYRAASTAQAGLIRPGVCGYQSGCFRQLVAIGRFAAV